MKLIQGVLAFKAKTAKVKDAKLRELSKTFSHFAVQKSRTGAWGIYAINEPGVLIWQGIYASLKMPSDALFLQRTEFGFYGFVVKDGLLEEEWVNSSLIDVQTAQAYVTSQGQAAAHRYAIYMCGFVEDADAIAVSFDIPDGVTVKNISLNQKAIERSAKLQAKLLRDIRQQSSSIVENIVMGLMAATVIGGGLWFYHHTENSDEEKAKKVAANPYEGLIKTLTQSGVNVKARLVQLYLNMENIRKLNGWKATAIVMESNRTIILLERDFGSWATLRDQAKKMGFQLTMLGGKYQLLQQVPVNVVMGEATNVPITGTVAYIKDALAYYWPEQMELQEKTRVTNSNWLQVAVEIRCQNIYPADLDSLGSLINGWPASFDKLKLTIAPNGSLSGTVTMQIIGS